MPKKNKTYRIYPCKNGSMIVSPAKCDCAAADKPKSKAAPAKPASTKAKTKTTPKSTPRAAKQSATNKKPSVTKKTAKERKPATHSSVPTRKKTIDKPVKTTMGTPTVICVNGKNVPVYEDMPIGWSEIIGAMTAPRGYEWISNGKSVFSKERRTAFLKLKRGK